MESTPKATPADVSATPIGISDAVEKLLAHPELLSSIASTLGLGKPSPIPVEGKEKSDEAEAIATASGDPLPPVAAVGATPSDLGEAVSALAPLLSSLSGKGGVPLKDDARTCLLRALKPYVSRERAAAIDTIIQVSRVSDVLKKLS